jgi:hypothetical protein
MEQLLAMYVAATLTEAACGASGGSNTISPDLSDPQVRAKNLQALETFRAYYQAVIQALNDPQDWPVPQVPVGGLFQKALQSVGPALPGLVTALAPLVSSTGPLGPLAGALMTVIENAAAATKQKAAPALPQNIPSPGAAPPPAATITNTAGGATAGGLNVSVSAGH